MKFYKTKKYDYNRSEIMEGFVREAINIERKHDGFNSWHEAYAVIKEEVEEFWDSVKENDVDIKELIQIMACCQVAASQLATRKMVNKATAMRECKRGTK